jgi:hypothetical protein
MTLSDCCVFETKAVKKSGMTEVISLFFRSPNHRRRRISAENEMSLADNSLQRTAKTASPARGLQLGTDSASSTGGCASIAWRTRR